MITKQSILNKLVQLNTSKAADPDGMHPSVLKSCTESLTDQLLSSGKLPIEWKTMIYLF